MAEVRMPKMGDGMEEGTILSWLKKEGDPIKEGEAIAEVETDKANVEIPAEESGVLTQIVVGPGQTVPVGAVIAQIGAPGATAATGNGTQAPGAGAPVAEPRRPTPEQKVPETEPVRSAEGAGVAREESTLASEARTPIEAEAGVPETERVLASPLARRMARELGIDLARLRGTGPGGSIRKRDIEAYQATAQQRPPAAPVALPEPTPAAPAAPRVAPPAPAPAPAAQEIKPSKMREAIARRTVQSKQTIPHFYVTMVIEMDRALALLKELNADAPDNKITVNDIIVKACAVALGKVPQVNATWTPEGTIRQYREAHIGVAVGIEEGLIIPVVRNCESKTLRQISAEAKALIAKARNNQLKPEEYSGGTFSTTNLGMMGADEFLAIINPPEAAILAIGAIAREPVVVGESDEIAIHSRMKVTLSADHRVLDGVVAAKFLQEVKRALEAPFALVS
ncbi:MAG TPA: dihydrolipoamide acetyltransferase family protein [Chthonomonadaceae bacterium]|nr:dihydrolipoamide acetyltransferase family protein [Chthonomonadaceae bacterium]